LKEFTTTEKDMKYKISRCPEDDFRIRDSEVQGTEYLDETSTESNEENIFDLSSPKIKHNENIENDEDDEDNDFDVRDTILMFSVKTDQGGVTLDDFDIKGVIGRGTFGKVFLAELKSTKKLYAIKSLRKDILVEAGQIENVKLEKDILMACDHPFLAGMEFVFQNDLRLYFVIEFLSGGELYKHFLKKRRFCEEDAKFYTS
jgi:hypothetical protein